MSEEIKVEGGADDQNKNVKLDGKEDFDPISMIKDVLFWFISKGIISLGIITTVLTLIGFFVIHSYINSFSSLFSYNINISQYLAAGVSLLIYLICEIFEALPKSLSIAVKILLVFFSLYLLYKKLNKLFPEIKKIGNVIGGVFFTTIRVIYTFSFSSVILILIIQALVYGVNNFDKMPRELGGGMPAEVIIIFNEDQPADLWGFSIIDPTNPRRSEHMQLLIELNDGVIVRHVNSGGVMIVKNDVIQGIVDISTLPIPTETPTPEPTASPTPSS